jgi:hypothetical protein
MMVMIKPAFIVAFVVAFVIALAVWYCNDQSNFLPKIKQAAPDFLRNSNLCMLRNPPILPVFRLFTPFSDFSKI